MFKALARSKHSQVLKYTTRCFSQEYDYACELAASSIRYGIGATKEIGLDCKTLGAKNVAVFTDQNLLHLPPVRTVLESLEQQNVKVHLYDQVRVEPNDASFKHAIDFLTQKKHSPTDSVDAIVAVGGGSVMDTAKAANLYACYPPDNFYDYVNPPVGKGLPVPGEVMPLIAIPTTAGTGSETTGVAIFDDVKTKSKTGVAHRRLKPYLGIVDPLNTADLPAEVARNCGFDVLCHAAESYTALPYNRRPLPSSPLLRPAYQGSNPISDIWSLHALRTTQKYLKRAVKDTTDLEARSNMILASTAAGIGFGNAGVHLCHGMSYPVASQVKSYLPPGYNVDHPCVPHGHSVIVNAPAVFRFTGVACPDRHLICAQLLAEGTPRADKYKSMMGSSAAKESAGKYLADEILQYMEELGVPLGLDKIGYSNGDIHSLVQGTLPQHRVTKISPRPVGEEELNHLFQDAMSY